LDCCEKWLSDVENWLEISKCAIFLFVFPIFQQSAGVQIKVVFSELIPLTMVPMSLITYQRLSITAGVNESDDFQENHIEGNSINNNPIQQDDTPRDELL
jgi:hypothetical protein